MNVRDALEADADALAVIADSPTDVMRNLVHDRTVRVAEDPACDGDDDSSSAESQYGGSDPDDILGFVSFDAQADTVHVTQISGTEEACAALLAEPIRFAEHEGMSVEVLVPPDNQSVERAATELGFTNAGTGPRFDGSETVRFHLDP